MAKGTVFWILMILWFFSWIGVRWGGLSGPYLYASELLLFVLLFLLGWQNFGFVIH